MHGNMTSEQQDHALFVHGLAETLINCVVSYVPRYSHCSNLSSETIGACARCRCYHSRNASKNADSAATRTVRGEIQNT